MKEQYLLCADIECDGGRWEKLITKDLCLKSEIIKEMAEDFYIKGTNCPATTILSNFNKLDAALFMFSVNTLFFIPVSLDEVIVRITETDAKKTIADLNAYNDETDYEKAFALYKYSAGCLSRITA